MNTLAILFFAAAGISGAHPTSQPTLRCAQGPRHTQARVRAPIKRAQKLIARKPSFPAVDLYAVNLNEGLKYRPYDDQGRPRKLAGRELERILRCWRSGHTHKIDPRLGKVLYQVARHYSGHRVEIFSGFRTRAYVTRDGSRHLTGSAVDLRVDGVKNEALIAWLRESFHPVGVGYYPNGVHVHLDVDRVHDAYWVDAGDTPGHTQPVVATGGLAPEAIEARSDEPAPIEVPSPAQTFDPPTEDPGIAQ